MQPSRTAGSRSRPEANDEWTHTRRTNRTAASQPWPVGGACRSSSGAVSTGCRAVAATPGCSGPDVCRDSAASSITHTPDFICCRGYEHNSAGSAGPRDCHCADDGGRRNHGGRCSDRKFADRRRSRSAAPQAPSGAAGAMGGRDRSDCRVRSDAPGDGFAERDGQRAGSRGRVGSDLDRPRCPPAPSMQRSS